MNTKISYILFCFFMLVIYSCRKQDTDNQWIDPFQTGTFATAEETDEDILGHVDSSWVKDVPVYGYVIPEIRYELDTCISPALRKCVTTYIDKYDKGGLYVYYCLYFFRRGTDNYFTIWQFVYAPKGWVEWFNPGIVFQYYWLTMHRQEIIFIFDPDDKQLLPFSPCINQLGDLDAKYLPEAEPNMIQDRFNFRTYKYIQKDNDFYIEPLKDAIYLGNAQDFAYELRFVKLEYGLPKD